MKKQKINYVYGLPEKKCTICGKLVIPTPIWLYKLDKPEGLEYYCSYKCYRKAGGDNG